MLKKVGIIIIFTLGILCLSNVAYGTIRGDFDNDKIVSAFDAYRVLFESLEDEFEEKTLQLIDMDCDATITAYDSYCVLKKSIADDPTDYVTPEMFGAVGDGRTDDTLAFEKCMDSNVKNILLSGDYLLKKEIKIDTEKHIYNGKIICQSDRYRQFTFTNDVTIKDTIFVCNRDLTGTAAHGETFQHSSNTSFVELWGKRANIEGCVFDNALTAIRGRISTGQEYVPDKLDVNHCRFTNSKMPIQGYFKYANIYNSSFRNDQDLYSGEHCVYIDAFESSELYIKGCLVETYNTESGAAFQIYGKEEARYNSYTINYY